MTEKPGGKPEQPSGADSMLFLSMLLPEVLRLARDAACRCGDCTHWVEHTMGATGRCPDAVPGGIDTRADGPPWGACRYFKVSPEVLERAKARGDKPLGEVLAEMERERG